VNSSLCLSLVDRGICRLKLREGSMVVLIDEPATRIALDKHFLKEKFHEDPILTVLAAEICENSHRAPYLWQDFVARFLARLLLPIEGQFRHLCEIWLFEEVVVREPKFAYYGCNRPITSFEDGSMDNKRFVDFLEDPKEQISFQPDNFARADGALILVKTNLKATVDVALAAMQVAPLTQRSFDQLPPFLLILHQEKYLLGGQKKEHKLAASGASFDQIVRSVQIEHQYENKDGSEPDEQSANFELRQSWKRFLSGKQRNQYETLGLVFVAGIQAQARKKEGEHSVAVFNIFSLGPYIPPILDSFFENRLKLQRNQ